MTIPLFQKILSSSILLVKDIISFISLRHMIVLDFTCQSSLCTIVVEKPTVKLPIFFIKVWKINAKLDKGSLPKFTEMFNKKNPIPKMKSSDLIIRKQRMAQYVNAVEKSPHQFAELLLGTELEYLFPQNLERIYHKGDILYIFIVFHFKLDSLMVT